jgi:hypothetical protein
MVREVMMRTTDRESRDFFSENGASECEQDLSAAYGGKVLSIDPTPYQRPRTGPLGESSIESSRFVLHAPSRSIFQDPFLDKIQHPRIPRRARSAFCSVMPNI